MTPATEMTPGAPPVEQLAAGLHVVRMPLPMRVAPVNCYVAERADGSLLVIDTGIAVAADELWTAALAAMDRAPADVGAIFVTHFHPDHIGASGPLARLTGAPVLASRLTAEQTPGTWGAGAAAGFASIDQHLLRHGMPPARLEELASEFSLVQVAVQVADEFDVVEAGDTLAFAGAEWELVATPGHADGHACLFDRAGSRLLAGDHLLERISPAVGLYPDHGPHPLASYLDSLERVAALAPRVVLPGHGATFGDGRARCAALVRHHRDRADACAAALDGGPATAWQVARTVFGDHLDADGERFATTEALAHLDWLEQQGTARWSDRDDGLVEWARC